MLYPVEYVNEVWISPEEAIKIQGEIQNVETVIINEINNCFQEENIVWGDILELVGMLSLENESALSQVPVERIPQDVYIQCPVDYWEKLLYNSPLWEESENSVVLGGSYYQVIVLLVRFALISIGAKRINVNCHFEYGTPEELYRVVYQKIPSGDWKDIVASFPELLFYEGMGIK